jgi:aspartate/methionine/tyrosine aminotransferase
MKACLAARIDILEPQAAYELLAKATRLEKKGKKILHFEIGQPDFPTPKNITKAGIDALKKGYTKYNPSLGIVPLRQEIAKHINKTRGINITEENISVTPSGNAAILTAMQTILEKGDEVIYPDPCFPSYVALIDFMGGIKKPVPLIEENDFSFDMNVFKKQFSKKTKIVILISPSNPTGGIIPYSDLKEIASIVKASNAWVFTDEVYARIIYDGIKYPSFYGMPEIRDRTFLIDAFSKIYSMTGWRIGYVAAPKKVIEKISYLLTHTIGCTATFTQYAALEALTGPQSEVKKMVKEFEKRRNLIVKGLNDIPGITCKNPQGAFYVFPNIKSFKKTSKWIADYIFDEAGVALLPGTAFGKYGEGYLRLSYANSIKNIEEGLQKIKGALSKL